MGYQSISLPELFYRVKDHVATSEKGPPFTLILGAGFSFPIIPTTEGIVKVDLPWWKWCQASRKDGPRPLDFFDDAKLAEFAEPVREYARNFWGGKWRMWLESFRKTERQVSVLS